MATGGGGMQPLQCVRLLTDRYKGEGVGQGAIGCILEVYDGFDGARYEVEIGRAGRSRCSCLRGKNWNASPERDFAGAAWNACRQGSGFSLLLSACAFNLEEWGAVMRYFLLKQHAAFTHAPCLINWFNVFDARKLRPETAREIPYRSLIAVKPDAMLCFTDVVLSPYLLLSASLKKVVAAYEPGVQYKDVVLLDKEHEQYELYYLPILEEVDCLHETSECTLDRSRIKRAVFAREKLSARSIFRVGGLKDAHIAVRLDLAESFLRRKAAGMALAEVEVV